MNQKLKTGFCYLVEIIDINGQVRDSETVDNLVPIEGLNHMLGVTLKGAAQINSWFIGLYEGNYTPQSSDTATTFPGSSTETTAYSEAARPVLTLGAATAGAADNAAARAEFTFNATKTIYGGFIASTSAKGSTSGILISAVRFSSPKVLASGEILRVTAGFTLVSV